MQNYNDNDMTLINMPIISIDITNIDQLYTNNVITYARFKNYIDLNFKIDKTIKKQYKMYTIRVPEKQCTKLELDKSIMVYRIDMKEIGNLFISIANSTHDLRVSN